MANTITAHAAAAEIVALINARPTSPRQDEIEAIIAKVSTSLPAADAEATARRVALQAAIAAMEAAGTDDGDVVDARDAPLTAITEEVWSRPPRSLADLQDYALIAKHWLGVHIGAPWSDPGDVDDWGDFAIAELIHAVLRFDQPAVPAVLATWEARAALERWQRCLHDFLDRCKDGAENEADWETMTRQSQLVWDRPVQNLDDVLLRAAVCIHWNSPGMATDPAYPDDVLAEGPECNMDAYSVAAVLRGLLDLSGLRFDQVGRLLSPAT